VHAKAPRAASKTPRAAIALCNVFLVACLATSVTLATAQSAPPAQNLLNQQAPDFTRQELHGHALHLNAFRGKVVLLNFWATWCAPCQVEMPVFSAWQRQYGPQGFAIIGISMDDDAAAARKLVKRLKLDYPNALGDARLGLRYGGVLGLPLTFLIDRNGVVRARFQGETDVKVMEKQVRALLAER
jgi:peroxiredoxin